MRFPAVICFFAASVPFLAQTTEPGTGAPTEAIRNQFASAYERGQFPRLAALPPSGPVRRHGATGLIQEFTDSTRTSGRLALVRATAIADDGNAVYQVLTDLFAHYSSVGVAAAGYPLHDTQACPDAACTWAAFSLNHALFAYSSGANDPQAVTVRDPFYTRWQFFGGISRMGAAISAETAVTSSLGGDATMQSFRSGVLYNVTSGALNGRLVAVREPVYALYLARGAHTGSLGLPTTDEQVLSNGRRRQTFQGGSIEYDENTAPVVRAPIASITLRPSTSPVRLAIGAVLTLQAVATGSDGAELSDRQVTFTTSNSRVASIEATGSTALVRAVGGGTARIIATAEGTSSLPVEIIVESQCCAVGEGAPTAAIQQSFQLAVARTRINVRLPGPERVRRAGSGYVQEFQGTDPNNPVRYLLAISDQSAQAYVVTGAILVRYEELGGPASVLGFPAGDASAAGRQVFEHGALAGSPLQLVTGVILTRWASTGYETGAPGLPAGPAAPVTSVSGATGFSQRFVGGVIAGTSKGAFLVAGAIAERYAADAGAAGALGFPTGEEVASAGGRRQEFEGGVAELSGSAVAVTLTERQPAASASPSSVLPGARVRLTVSGFPDRSTLRIGVQGQQDFIVSTRAGAFTWEVLVPASASPGPVRITAIATDNSALNAEGTYTVRSLAEARVQITKVLGDTQTGAPGSVLPHPLRIQLKDEAGNPVSGMTIRFTASPGASTSPESATTDLSGYAETRLRLPDSDRVALVSAEGARQVATFSARAAGAAILNFPRLSMTSSELLGHGSIPISESGALLTALASMVRFYQNKGSLGAPNGLADVATLNDFLRRTCSTDSRGQQFCDGFLAGRGGGAPIVNIWRLPRFVGGTLEVALERADMNMVRALVSGGSPVLVALDVDSGNGRGSHFVVATGVASDGSLSVFDPDPVLGRTRLSDYLDGFQASGQTWKGELAAVLRLAPGTIARSGFAVLSDTPVAVTSRAGVCGTEIAWLETPVRTATSSGEPPRLRQRYCDGEAAEYQMEFAGGSGGRATVIDLGEGGSRTELAGGGPVAFRLARPGSSLEIAPQTVSIAPRGIVNAANFTPDVAPGGLAAIFGRGLARAGTDTRVLIGGRPAAVVAALPFQLNVQVPFEAVPGMNTVVVESPWGTVEQQVEVRSVAPAIFRTGSGNNGAVVNQSGELNTPLRPARRGEAVVIYATGLGAVTGSGALKSVQNTVTAVAREQELRVLYAGLTPGFIGLYQINLVIPVTLAPGIEIPLTLRQGNWESVPVDISVL